MSSLQFSSLHTSPLFFKRLISTTPIRVHFDQFPISASSPNCWRLVCRQLVHYLSSNGLLPDLQSAYIPHRSTETAILRILSDILLALAILSLLDLSAAFDSVDHDTLLIRLHLILMGALVQY